MMTAPERWPRDTTFTGMLLSARSMTSGASMYAACRRPDISDSLISGQPLYLLNSKRPSSGLPPGSMPREAAHAIGIVRLHVTGKPPTTRAFACACALGSAAHAAAAPAASSSLRRGGENGTCGRMASNPEKRPSVYR
jgi:hypothetical protein